MAKGKSTFEERFKLVPPIEIQINSMDTKLKNKLWNLIYSTLEEFKTSDFSVRTNKISNLAFLMWHDFLGEDIQTIPESLDMVINKISTYYNNFQWWEVYKFIEFLIEPQNRLIRSKNFIQRINYELENCNSAFRVVDNSFVKITNEIEINEIVTAIENGGIEGIKLHIRTALKLMSDRENSDYRNSIKESITAVETVCRVAVGASNLGKAFKNFESKGIIINSQLKSGFENIYAWTNGKDGIRHSIMDGSNPPTLADARFMLVSCSAFINYFIVKCNEVGIKFKNEK